MKTFSRFGPVPALVLGAFVTGLLACNAHVDSDYQGEPLATLEGVVGTEAALDSDAELDAAVVWTSVDGATRSLRLVGTRVSVAGTFPASFTLDLFTPPPSEGEMVTQNDYEDLDGAAVPLGEPTGLWLGVLAAIDRDADDSDIAAEDLRGIDPTHMLVYFDSDIPPEALDRPSPPTAPWTAEEWLLEHKLEVVRSLKVPPVKGYHLAKVNPESRAAQRALEDCLWDGLCVHWTVTDMDPVYADRDFQHCTERFPSNPTCKALWDPQASEPVSSVECRERYASQVDEDACYAAMPIVEPYVDNPDGLADTVAIEMGTGLLDLGR